MGLRAQFKSKKTIEQTIETIELDPDCNIGDDTKHKKIFEQIEGENLKKFD